MHTITTFLGENVDFWVELKTHADSLDVTRLISEIATLRAKVSFYESRLADMEMFRKRNVYNNN